MKNKTALIVAAADGISTMQSGVGMVVQSFFEAFSDISYSIGNPDLDLYAVCPLVNRNSNDFSEKAYGLVNDKCIEYGGSVIMLDKNISGISLNEIWKGTKDSSPSQIWNLLCKELINFSLDSLKKYDKIILICHDTLFANISNYTNNKNIEICWIPHSLGTLFCDPNQMERIDFEKNSVARFVRNGNWIGYISEITKDHLMKKYNVPKENIIPFLSGIYFESHRYFSSNFTQKLLKENNIPKDKILIFSWGRCSDQKGFDLIIGAYKNLLRQFPECSDKYHLVLICPTETTYKEYLDLINEELRQLPKNSFTIFDKFQENLQYNLLRYENTEIILLCSRYESFGLTSIEALLHRSQRTIIIYSPLQTFSEVLDGMDNCIELNQNSVAEIENKLISHVKSPFPFQNENAVKVKERLSKYSLVKNQSKGVGMLLNKSKYI